MTLTAFVSTAARDRYDEVLDPKGVDISNYNKNPVVLWAHKYDIPLSEKPYGQNAMKRALSLK